MQHFAGIIEKLRTFHTEHRETAYYQLHPRKCTGKTAYVDGGNACVLQTPWYCIHFVRAALCVLQGATFHSVQRFELFAIANKVKKACHIDLFGAPSFLFLPDTLEISYGEAGNAIRCLLEKAIIATAKEGYVFLVRDGLLEGVVNPSIPLIGLAKTSEQLPFFAKEGRWYTPVDDGYAVRLHANAQSYFRVQMTGDPSALLPDLAWLSRDLVFPGYPYGLIMADRFARVSNDEKEYILCLLECVAGKEWKMIQSGLFSAHTVLDAIS